MLAAEACEPGDALARLNAMLGLSAGAPGGPDLEVVAQVLSPGSVLFRAGEPSDAMYLVLRGELQRRSRMRSRGRSSSAGSSGRTRRRDADPLGGTRMATVRAISEAEVVRTSRHAVERLVRRNQLVSIPSTHFGVLDGAMLGEIEAGIEWKTLARGATLFEQDELADRVYILVSGRLQAVVGDAAGGARILGEIGRGEIIGEMAILTGEPRSARVRALRDSELVSLDRQAFDRLVVRYPQMLMALTRLVIHRLREAQSGQVQESPARTIAVVAAGPHAPLAAFARCLAVALAELDTTLHLGAADSIATSVRRAWRRRRSTTRAPRASRRGSTSRRPGIASWFSKRMREPVGLERTLRAPGRPLAGGGTCRRRSDAGCSRGRAPRTARGRRTADQPRHHPPAGHACGGRDEPLAGEPRAGAPPPRA